jgi:perosamine synthetase
MIPISRLSVGEAEAKAAYDVIKSGWIAQGKKVEEFEKLVAAYVGAKHGVAVSSATTGLQLALLAAGVKPGDEVICPSYSFIATANSIAYVNAKPVFVDIDPRTYNIDVSKIEAAITPRTRAIMPVSQVGLGADLEAVMKIARKHNLKVVEDAAPSFGAIVNGKKVGSISDLSVFSFDARKILTVGEGGVVTTDDDAMAKAMRDMRAHSASASMLARHTTSNVVLERYPALGFNFKMTDINGAIGIVQMGHVEEFIAQRRRLADRYVQLLKDERRIELPYEPAGYRHVWQSYTVRILSNHSQLQVMTDMAKKEVATRRVIACHLEGDHRKNNPQLVLPESEAATSRTLLLPMFAGMTDAEQDSVVGALKYALDQAEDLADEAPRRAAHG